MDGPIGMDNSGNIEFSYTLWFKINRTFADGEVFLDGAHVIQKIQ